MNCFWARQFKLAFDGEPADEPMLFAGLPARKIVQFNFERRRAERLR